VSIELEPEQHELIHDLVVTTNTQLDNIAQHHQRAYGPAILALMTFLIEKTYMSAKMEDANAVIQCAQDVGLQNWIDQSEGVREEPPRIVTLDDGQDGGV
jgi:hypothetical protein